MSIADFDYFILRCLILGYTSRQIAGFIHYSQPRVSQRVASLCKRFGVRGQAALVQKMRSV